MMKKAKAKMIETGTAILTDFERKIYEIIPAPKQAIAVRVPVGNIPHTQATPVKRKKYLNFLILHVIANIRKAVAVEAKQTPQLAASLNVEKYLTNVPP